MILLHDMRPAPKRPRRGNRTGALPLNWKGSPVLPEPVQRGETHLSEREKRVCLDPGHDAGNLANKSPDGTYYEHVFTLDLGKRLEKLLTDRGVSVTMTRTGGGAVSLARRCEIANSIPDLDLFVSLHSNAAAGGGWSSAKGWSVYLYGPGGDRERAAQDILEQVRAAGIAVRSTPIVYDPELYVLKHTKAPAVLLENGFHTNREEAALLGQADYRQKLAVAEAKGILEYLGIPWVETEEETDYQAEARAAVDWLTENGIMQGNAEGDLMLDQPLTRRQFAVLEYRIAKLEGFV